jgi:hypothetical protein
MGFRMEKIRITNICCKCKHWDECFKYRYGNKPQDYMKKYIKEKDNWGQDVIFVEKCSKFKKENQERPPRRIIMYTDFEYNIGYDIIPDRRT